MAQWVKDLVLSLQLLGSLLGCGYIPGLGVSAYFESGAGAEGSRA